MPSYSIDPLWYNDIILRQINVAKALNLPNIPPTAEEETEFWENILSETKNNENIEYAIFKRINWLLKENKINFFIALKYFLNLLIDHKKYNAAWGELRWFKQIKILFPCRRNTGFISSSVQSNDTYNLLHFLVDLPLIYVPNLAYFILNNNENIPEIDVIRNNFHVIRNDFSFPRFKHLSRGKGENRKKNRKGNQTLKKEYENRKDENDFISSEILYSLVAKLSPNNRKKIIKLVNSK